MQLARPDSDERRGRGCLKLVAAEILNWLAAKMIEPSHRASFRQPGHPLQRFTLNVERVTAQRTRDFARPRYRGDAFFGRVYSCTKHTWRAHDAARAVWRDSYGF